jgi:hypothetical protein
MAVYYITLHPFLTGNKFYENVVKFKHLGTLTNQNCTHEERQFCLVLDTGVKFGL